MTSEVLDYLDALRNRCSEVFQTLRDVALVDVVGPAPYPGQFLAQLLHDRGAIVDSLQQDRLVAHGNASINEHLDRALRYRRDLLRMVEVCIEPNRVILPQHPDQLRCDPVREDDRSP